MEVRDIVIEALKVLLFFGGPAVVIVALCGSLAAALQSATAIQEPALAYAVRLAALLVVFYFVLPGTMFRLTALLGMVLQ